MIANPMIPLKTYNYTYIQQLLADTYHENVSAPTLITVAKKHGFFLPKRERKAHDREGVTNDAGELLQHDASHHLFAPYAGEKWYLVTTIDDYSRMLLYARIIKQETTWAHIVALQHVCVTQGILLSATTWIIIRSSALSKDETADGESTTC